MTYLLSVYAVAYGIYKNLKMSQCSDFSWFASVDELHPREIFALERQFKEDDCDHKINLGNVDILILIVLIKQITDK